MGGIESIINNIISESKANAEKTMFAAKTQGEAIITKVTAEAEQIANEKIERAKKNAEEVNGRALSMAALEGRKMLLTAKREIIDEVFDRAELFFLKLPKDKYIAFLANLARNEVGGNLIFSKKDKPLCEDVLNLLDKQRFFLSDEISETIKSGFILKNGAVEMNCSIQSVISEKRKAIEPFVASKLFE